MPGALHQAPVRLPLASPVETQRMVEPAHAPDIPRRVGHLLHEVGPVTAGASAISRPCCPPCRPSAGPPTGTCPRRAPRGIEGTTAACAGNASPPKLYAMNATLAFSKGQCRDQIARRVHERAAGRLSAAKLHPEQNWCTRTPKIRNKLREPGKKACKLEGLAGGPELEYKYMAM